MSAWQRRSGGRRDRTDRPRRSIRTIALPRAVCVVVFDQAEFHKAGSDGAGGAAVGGRHLWKWLMRREFVTELLFFLGRPGPSGLWLVRIDDSGCSASSFAKATAGRAAATLKSFQGQEQGADGVGLLVGAVRRELQAGCRIPAVGERAYDLLGLIRFHVGVIYQIIVDGATVVGDARGLSRSGER